MSSYLLLPDKELLAQTDSDHAIICTLIQVFFFKATSLLPVFPAGPHRTWKQHLPYHISCPPAFWKNHEWLFRRHTAAKSVSSVNSTFIFLKQKEPQACTHKGERGSFFQRLAATVDTFTAKQSLLGLYHSWIIIFLIISPSVILHTWYFELFSFLQR